MIERERLHFCIRLAGHTVAVDAMYPRVYSLCQDYPSDLSPEIQVNISEDDIAYECTEAQKTHATQDTGYLETLAVYRKISEAMLSFDTFLMHGAVVAVDDEAYMFTASSGTGKTTHILKWKNNIQGAFVVNGDKPLIKISETKAIACGTPWCGKEQLGTNTMVPLKAIVLMERSENNFIEEVSFGKALVFLLQQVYRPVETVKIKKTLALLSELSARVRFFRFCFNNKKDDAFSVSYNALIGKNSICSS